MNPAAAPEVQGASGGGRSTFSATSFATGAPTLCEVCGGERDPVRNPYDLLGQPQPQRRREGWCPDEQGGMEWCMCDT